MSNPHDGSTLAKAQIPEEEDLFSFDELSDAKGAVGDSATIAPATAAAPAFNDLNEEAMSAVLGPDPRATAKAAPPAGTVVAAGSAPIVGGPTAQTATQNQVETTASTPAGAAPRAKLDLKSSPLLAAGLAVFAVANLALIGLTWKSMSTLQQSLTTRAPERDPSVVEPGPRAIEPFVEHPRIPAQLEVRPEGEETLEAAHEAIERGDFEGARRVLYGLLAVADRWEPARRDDLEARATFTIADSYRLQAEVRKVADATDAARARDDGAVRAAESAGSPESSESNRAPEGGRE